MNVELRIRPATPADVGPVAQLHLDNWRATYANLLPKQGLAEFSRATRKKLWDDA